MSKKQTRRSISVSGEVYDRLQEHTKAAGTTCSGVVEWLLRGFFEMPERDQKEVVAPIPRFVRKTAADGFRDPVPRQPRQPPQAKPQLAVSEPAPGIMRVRVMTTPELGPEAAWVEKGPADRVQVIKDAAEFKAAFEKKKVEPDEKAESLKKLDQASKIFTF
jgi:hypothetical protein